MELDRWGNDQSLKKIIQDLELVKKWICYSSKDKNDFLDPYFRLLNARREGLDKYDPNLVAAERYMEGCWNKHPRLIINAQQNIKRYRESYPILQNILGKNGSSIEDNEFVTTFGFLGVLDSNNKVDIEKRCGCER